MSDTKVKVAVRVRPMNRRGKYVSARALTLTFFFLRFLIIRHRFFKLYNDGSLTRARFPQKYLPLKKAYKPYLCRDWTEH